MAIQATPPIQLDPSMDRDHELAFINQNFNNIASVIGQNSFVILQSATVSQTLTNTANVVAGNNSLQSINIAHNLGFVPTFLVYATAPAGFISGAVLFMLPHTTFLNDGTANDGLFFTHFYATADSTNLTINYMHNRNTDYSPSVPTFSIKYYLFQQTAN